ncbi:hypothetical protein [Sedimenticola sp.]|uniref:hypothetical protein n=1 Tax=Sedimenticola sp. TaxID=1940285 RepID=UPI003D131D88
MSKSNKIIWLVKPECGWNAGDNLLTKLNVINYSQEIKLFENLGFTVNVLEGCTQEQFLRLLKQPSTHGFIIASHGDDGGFPGIHLDRVGGGADVLQASEIPKDGVSPNLRFAAFAGCQLQSLQSKYAKALGLSTSAVFMDPGLSSDGGYWLGGGKKGDLISFIGLPSLMRSILIDYYQGKLGAAIPIEQEQENPDAGVPESPDGGPSPRDAGPAGGISLQTTPTPSFLAELAEGLALQNAELPNTDDLSAALAQLGNTPDQLSDGLLANTPIDGDLDSQWLAQAGQDMSDAASGGALQDLWQQGDSEPSIDHPDTDPLVSHWQNGANPPAGADVQDSDDDGEDFIDPPPNSLG